MRIAVIGDVHETWDTEDSRAIDALAYDLVLFVGDLGDRLHRNTLAVARRLATLRTRALLLPGNHDGTTPLGVLAEAVGRGLRRPGSGARAVRRLDALQLALGPIAIVGYSAHPGPEATVIAARPHAMDGRRLTFAPVLEARHAVPTMAASARRLRELVEASSGPIVFLAHNGPFGLGADPQAPFALRRGGRDLGDPDLADALHWARREGRQVAAVVAGHCHHDGERRWLIRRDHTLYVNAARVPRRRTTSAGEARHHVELIVEAGDARAREVWLDR